MINASSLKESLSLNGNALKVIAIIAMTIDHLAWMGKFFYLYYPVHMALIGLITHNFLH